MPVTFLAHQAPVLPLKRRWPGLDGVALVVGSTVPDLARATERLPVLYLYGTPTWFDGHRPDQLGSWCLVVGLLHQWRARRGHQWMALGVAAALALSAGMLIPPVKDRLMLGANEVASAYQFEIHNF